MSLILSGSDGLSDVDGSASTPAIRGTDANTGIFFPAADTVAVATGGSERMRVDSSGNVGIGTTNSVGKLTVCPASNDGNVSTWANGQFLVAPGGTTTSTGLGISVDTVNNVGYFSSLTPGVAWRNLGYRASQHIFYYGGTTEAMRIDSSGNVGIGTSSPNGRLDVTSTSAGANTNTLFLTNASSNASTATSLVFGVSTTPTTRNATIQAINAGGNAINLAFLTSNADVPAERARITSGGEVYIAGTTDQGAYNLQCNGTGVWGAGAYVNGSDARIKEDVAPIDCGLDVVEKLNPVTYRYKEDWSKDQSVQTGFIAQELLTALDGKNYVDGIVQQGGSEGYYSVAYQNIIPILTKAIQELSAKNAALEARIAVLEAK